MDKKIMLLALAAVSAAMVALPAAASALPAHISATTGFSLHGSAGLFQNTSGSKFECSTTTGSGSFSTTTKGTMTLIFHGCKESTFGFACTTPGQPSGTIALATLDFDLIMLKAGTTTGEAGILVTPPAGAATVTTDAGGIATKEFAHFSCLGITTKMIGNGLIGTITSPTCTGAAQKTATLKFEQSATVGHQKHIEYTGVKYDLSVSMGGGAHVTTAINSSTTLTFNGGVARSIHCT